METWLQIVLAVLGSSGLWAGIFTLLQTKINKKSASNKMLVGLGHDRIVWLCGKYIERGWITKDEYEDLHDYLYIPYRDMGGNGTAEKLMTEVEKLPVRHLSHLQQFNRNKRSSGWFGRTWGRREY